jgi:hypothetical protein
MTCKTLTIPGPPLPTPLALPLRERRGDFSAAPRTCREPSSGDSGLETLTLSRSLGTLCWRR